MALYRPPPVDSDAYMEAVERRRAYTAVSTWNRADHGLRQIAMTEGDAVWCRKCDGSGYLSRGVDRDPVKCGRCFGEGLEPPE